LNASFNENITDEFKLT